ncbi:hypothetical protein BN59_02260 [Legionella massiliensis]|uniref:YgjP-like metallopeptidase domain-containing protein n=1 Tax=Legionella massiliensis TaxID=1034943 RepID=A0A078L1S6_9GAMM|nr:SprT family zinc-dependent metalloprotease [Legionella massiliensis]CDZ77964.1 hypothetical protein BN59_02260 [Legionella massiliensis]CEE13702.1 hypothetical protein BN1094_02260 [Legionella massiliensis]
MATNQFELDGIAIEILRKPIKNIHLRIYPPDGQVRVTAPLRLRLDLIHKQIEAKRAWIHAQRARFRAKLPLSPLTFETGEQHFFLGKAYTLRIHHGVTRPAIHIDTENLDFYIQPEVSTEQKQRLLDHWYRRQMKALLPGLIAKWEPIIAVQVANWGIKLMKTRWGSCNPVEKRIWLNLRLIKKPLICLEYVLVHELVHILEASHNKRFYAFMDQFLPNWRQIQKLLESS